MARATDIKPYSFEFAYLITGYHVFKTVCQYSIDEVLVCEREAHDVHDLGQAVRISKDGTTVGHVPRDISKACTFLILYGGSMKARVTDRHQNRKGNGIETPCKYSVKGPCDAMCKAEKVIKNYLNRTCIS